MKGNIRAYKNKPNKKGVQKAHQHEPLAEGLCSSVLGLKSMPKACWHLLPVERRGDLAAKVRDLSLKGVFG